MQRGHKKYLWSENKSSSSDWLPLTVGIIESNSPKEKEMANKQNDHLELIEIYKKKQGVPWRVDLQQPFALPIH